MTAAAPLLRACMGGWCHLRDRCQHHTTPFRGNPAERLCVPGFDGYSDQRGMLLPLSDAIPPMLVGTNRSADRN